MNMNKSFEKKIKSMRRTQNHLNNRTQTAPKSTVIGSWILEEDEEGNLLATNIKTGEATIVAFL